MLYQQPARNQGLLAGQAELLTRLMPALAALMAAEAARCPHTQPRNGFAAGGAAHHGGQATTLPALTPGERRG